MPTDFIQNTFDPEQLNRSEVAKYSKEEIHPNQMLLQVGPQHPSTHGVLRLEVLLEGEIIVDVVPHLGYLHRCFEKHAEALPFNQIIPYVDRMDYLAAMNSEHVYALGLEQILGITEQIPPRTEFIRILVSELNRLASHFMALGTYAMDLGAFTPFLWMMRDREHILRLLEWLSGARLLYNYIWIGGLFYDTPLHFEEKVRSLIDYIRPKLRESTQLIFENKIFLSRTGGIGTIPQKKAVELNLTGPMLRGSGLARDLRKRKGYSRYDELDFQVPVGNGEAGQQGDAWDRTWVRLRECQESIRLIDQVLELLTKKHPKTRSYNPRSAVPKKIRPKKGEYFFSGDTPKGELGFYVATDGRSDIPLRLKAKSPCFTNLQGIAEFAKGHQLADLIAIIGSIDIVMGEVDR